VVVVDLGASAHTIPTMASNGSIANRSA